MPSSAKPHLVDTYEQNSRGHCSCPKVWDTTKPPPPHFYTQGRGLSKGSGTYNPEQALLTSIQCSYLQAETHYLNLNLFLALIGLTQIYDIRSVQSLSRVRLFATPWTTAHQASLSITNSWSLLRLMSIESVMPSNHLIL